MNIGFKKRWIKLIVQIVFFIVLSIVFVYPFQKNGIIYFGDDMKYHVNRILELINNLKNGNIGTGTIACQVYSLNRKIIYAA